MPRFLEVWIDELLNDGVAYLAAEARGEFFSRHIESGIHWRRRWQYQSLSIGGIFIVTEESACNARQ